VTFTGKGFIGITSVKFGNNTESAPFTAGAGGTTLTVTVPANATYGQIGINSAGGTTLSSAFAVLPKITSFTPTSGRVGTVVTITGSGFGGADQVNFNGASAAPTSATANTVKVLVPLLATTGHISVHTPTGGTSADSTQTFTVIPSTLDMWLYLPTL
jgi:hypothetical protein